MSIWDKYPEFSKSELRTLVAVTAQVLLESQPKSVAFTDDLLEISPQAASRKLLPLFQETNPKIEKRQIQQILEDADLSERVCLQILGEVLKYPDLSQCVADAYEREARMMDVGVMLLLVGALVILAININEIHIVEKKNRKGTEKEIKITFSESGEIVKDFITSLIKNIRNGGIV